MNREQKAGLRAKGSGPRGRWRIAIIWRWDRYWCLWILAVLAGLWRMALFMVVLAVIGQAIYLIVDWVRFCQSFKEEGRDE